MSPALHVPPAQADSLGPPHATHTPPTALNPASHELPAHTGCAAAPQATHIPPTLTVRPVQVPPPHTGCPVPPHATQAAPCITKPALQARTHVPDVHAAVPLAGAEQAALQAPQCCTLVRVSLSQPLALLPSQLAKPVAQANVHMPPAQLAVAPGPEGHALPHAPQC